MLTHKKMSLFDASRGSILVHGCNSQGMWGSGIARPFRDNYPEAFLEYNEFCKYHNDHFGSACGQSGIYEGEKTLKHKVAWIITSHNYGQYKDSPERIKINTTLALAQFCQNVSATYYNDSGNPIEVYSNKFNSGLFNVPWESSELILETVLKRHNNINWIVCDPEGK